MKYRPEKLRFLVLAICLQAILCSCKPGLNSEKLIRKTFETYTSSIINEEYDKAADCLDSRTRNYYSIILHHVMFSDSITIENLSLLDKLSVILTRASTNKQEIEHLDGKSFFAFLLSKGFVGKNSIISSYIGEVEIDKNFA